MKKIFLPKGMSKKRVKEFFTKVDGQIVGKTSKSNACPLYNFLVKELGYSYVDVETSKITIGNKKYNITGGWPERFVVNIDAYGTNKNRTEALSDQYGHKHYEYWREVTGDECLNVLKEIENEI